MNVTIRMIGLATTFCWIFLLAFFASVAYSIKDLRFNFGDLQTSVTSDNRLLLALPINIENTAYYNIGSFNITTEISDVNGFSISRGSTLIPIIRNGESLTSFHNVTLDINSLIESDSYYLFNDGEFCIDQLVSFTIAEIIPVQVKTNFSIPWGAPLYNFTLKEPITEGFNLTHFRVITLISFENHAPLNLTGNMIVKIYNNTESLVGQEQTTIEVAHYSPYEEYVEFYVPINGFTTSGRFEVYFLTHLFNYGPLVIPYG
ncbi:MAG: hypothetical protein QXH37_00185 [Candidatus Bathyarchaeia archaeon]